MKRNLIRLAIVLAASAAVYFFSLPRTSPVKTAPPLASDEYPAVVLDLRERVTDISPTPPTEKRWTVREVEFAENSDLAYITYHDTHNVFRLLVSVIKQNGQYQYRVLAQFEKSEDGYRKLFGEDTASQKSLIRLE